jgi:SWI/SNF-related matrix-associated actin-dependent regulator of chromatin subfamily A member 5
LLQNKAVNGIKGTPNGTSRAASEDTTASAGAAKAKGRARKK